MPGTPVFAFISLEWQDIVDILLVAVLIYQLYMLVRGTVAIRIFLGILSIYLFWKLVEALQMELLTEILGQFIGVGVIALIIVFQQELRKFLLFVGNTGFRGNGFTSGLFYKLSGRRRNEPEMGVNVTEIDRAVRSMSEQHTGALMVVSRAPAGLSSFTGGKRLDALLSADLIESIFFKNSPLHDGAIVIEGNVIVSARNVLPVSENPDLPGRYGMRHRAAIGVTENTDSIAITVSEETGTIAIAKNGTIRELTPENFKEALIRAIA